MRTYKTEWEGELGDRKAPPGGGIILAMLLEAAVVALAACIALAGWWVLGLATALQWMGL